MKLVIDIPEEAYELVRHSDEFPMEVLRNLLNAIIKGTPLPEHHGDCISREVVIDGLDRYIKKVQSTGSKDDFLSFQELVVKQLPSVTPKAEWIPVSERLPEDGRTVLVWYEYFRYGDYNKLFQTYGLSYAYGGHWSEFVNGESGWKDLRIIAWMPLPEPYKEESEEE